MTTKLTGNYSAVSAAAAVVSTQSAAEFDGMLLDLWTASAIVALHSALNPTNAAKLAAMDHPCYGTRTAHIDKVNSASYYLDGSQWPSKFPKASQIKRDETGAFLIYGGGASQKSDELFLTIQSGKGNDDA